MFVGLHLNSQIFNRARFAKECLFWSLVTLSLNKRATTPPLLCFLLTTRNGYLGWDDYHYYWCLVVCIGPGLSEGNKAFFAKILLTINVLIKNYYLLYLLVTILGMCILVKTQILD